MTKETYQESGKNVTRADVIKTRKEISHDTVRISQETASVLLTIAATINHNNLTENKNSTDEPQ